MGLCERSVPNAALGTRFRVPTRACVFDLGLHAPHSLEQDFCFVVIVVGNLRKTQNHSFPREMYGIYKEVYKGVVVVPFNLHKPQDTPAHRSRGSTKRSPTRPLGRPDSEAVRNGNVMTARVCILLLLAATRGVWSILEQPSTSLMHLHPTFQRVMAMMNIRGGWEFECLTLEERRENQHFSIPVALHTL